MEPVRPVPPAERGATRISERVVAKLAVQAAREALAGSPSPHPAGAAHPRGAAPRATAVVRRPPTAEGGGGLASVRVSVELGYPSDIGAQCREVRRQVARRVGELAGMEVPDVAVDVERLHSVHFDGGAPGRVR